MLDVEGLSTIEGLSAGLSIISMKYNHYRAFNHLRLTQPISRNTKYLDLGSLIREPSTCAQY